MHQWEKDMAAVEKLVAEEDRTSAQLIELTSRNHSAIKSAVQRLKASGRIIAVRTKEGVVYRKAPVHEAA